eukprot:2160231-Rhodomonas_salina.1
MATLLADPSSERTEGSFSGAAEGPRFEKARVSWAGSQSEGRWQLGACWVLTGLGGSKGAALARSAPLSQLRERAKRPDAVRLGGSVSEAAEAIGCRAFSCPASEGMVVELERGQLRAEPRMAVRAALCC